MKKTLIALLAATIAASAATAVSAWVENGDYVKLGEITAENYPASPSTGLPEVTSGQLLKGTIFTSTNAQGIQCDGANNATLMFDANPATHFKEAHLGWAGLILDQAYELTEVRVAPNPNLDGGSLFNFWLQGSNDGENWVNIIIMRQDAYSNDYHIFTPQTVTDQRYIDAGYKVRTDESVHWLADGGSYKMYRVHSASVGELELYGNPAPATELTAEEASTMNVATPYWYPYITHIRSNAEVKNAADGSLVGTIIGGGGIWNKANYEKAFDNNNKTHFDPSLEGPECWVGMMFDEPHALTEVRILPKRGAYTDVQYGHFQGSLDGHNWVDLAVLTKEDVPSKQNWITKTITDTKGYTHFRFVSAGDTQTTVSEMLLFGAPAAAAEPFEADRVIATVNKYTGPIEYSTTKNVVADTEISGTPICGQWFYGWRDRDSGMEAAFDNKTDTHYGTIPRLNGSWYWFGLKADVPTAVSSVVLNLGVDTFDENLYFQGSVDGVNWTTLTTINTLVDTKDAANCVTKSISDTNVYDFFRLVNDDTDHPNASLSAYELKIYAAAPAETQAPETAAPETAAPETTAPETTAPETPVETTAPEAPVETTAPSTGDDEPTAPQTFDFGVIAAAAAVISAAGYAIARKRK